MRLLSPRVPRCRANAGVVAAETWGLALNPKSLHLATSGGKATVRVMSSAVETFGDELTTMAATGTFGTAIKYVRPQPLPTFNTTSYESDLPLLVYRVPTEGFSPSQATRDT